MPHDRKRVVIVQVPFAIDDPVLARLKKEAMQETGKPYAGPHIAKLLANRDGFVYGGSEEAKKQWLPSNPSFLVPAIDQAVHDALKRELPKMFAGLSLNTSPVDVQPVEEIGICDEEEIDSEAAAYASSLGNWDDDDEDDE